MEFYREENRFTVGKKKIKINKTTGMGPKSCKCSEGGGPRSKSTVFLRCTRVLYAIKGEIFGSFDVIIEKKRKTIDLPAGE